MSEFLEADVVSPAIKSKIKPSFNSLVINVLKRTNFKFWGIMTISLFLLWANSNVWTDKKSDVVLDNTQDIRAIPAFDLGLAVSNEMEAIADHENNVSAFYHEAQQKEVIQMALAFQSLSAQFIQQLGHPTCAGKTQLECLKTFRVNRVNANLALAERERGRGDQLNSIMKPIEQKAIARLKAESLRLAETLSTPHDLRQDWQNHMLQTYFPVIYSGTPLSQLKQSPSTLATLVNKSISLEERLEKVTPEYRNFLFQCLQQEFEERSAACKTATQ